jgi:tetratricopeptide (TPR) repeat protein
MNEANQKEVIAAIEKHVTLEGVDDQEERNLVEAKTLWNSASFNIEDAQKTDQLVARIDYIREDSKQAFEKNLILALFYSEKKDFKKSLVYARRMVKQMQRLNSRQKVQVLSFAGEVGNLALDFEFSGKTYRDARLGLGQLSDKDQGELTFRHLSATPTPAYLIQSEGESLEKQEKWKEAVALYTEAIENKIGGNHILYSHAKAILKNGGKESKQRASVSLEKIQQSQDDDVWKRLAQEKLKEIAKEGKVDGKSNP